MKKTITIKNALVEDKEYLDKLSNSLETGVSGALSHIVNIVKNKNVNEQTVKVNQEETDKRNVEIQRLTSIIETLSKENAELKNRKPETVEKTITIEKQLTGSQFICELSDEIAYNARKVRKWAVKDGFVKGENYPNELANLAIKQWINREYIDLIE